MKRYTVEHLTFTM